MSNVEATSVSPSVDAGFWKRALAFAIDVAIVGTAVSVIFLVLAAAVPGIGRMVVLSTPFGIGTVERTVEDKSTETTDANGTKTIKIDKIIERSVLERWVYRYRVEGEKKEYPGDAFVTSVQTNLVWQIDPETGDPIVTTGVNEIALAVLMLYWIAADAGRRQASFGKRILGLKVADVNGARLTLAAAAGRNLLKILSAIPVFIGFMMAGWTKRKQALHDMIVGSYVLAGR
jgi:uncharacterized RDD family membrane protein YckC